MASEPGHDSESRREAAHIFAALGDATRLKLSERLRAGPLSLAALTEGSDLTRQAIAKHLRVLEQAGLAVCERRGRESLWSLTPAALQPARQHLERLSAAWDLRLDALRHHVETNH